MEGFTQLQVPEWAKHPPRSSRTITCTCAAIGIIMITLWSLLAGTKSQPPEFPWLPTFEPDERLDIRGINGAVASDSDVCSQMGVKVLEKGGSAADAAVTTALCIGTVHPASSGIGGGGFIMLRFPNGSATTIDCRETAPAKAHKHMFDGNPTLSKIGGLASGVPGELAGLHELWKQAGTLDWKELVQPIADMNSNGFIMNEALGLAAEHLSQRAATEPAVAEILKLGDWNWLFDIQEDAGVRQIKRPALAHTLELVAEYGAEIFYDPEGPIAPYIAKSNQLGGGIMTVEDIGNYTAVIREPLETMFMGRQVFTTPAPTSGPALIMGLHVIEQLMMDGNMKTVFGPIETQRMVETMKWMAAARSHLGDPAFADNPTMHQIPTEEWAHNVVGNISDDHTQDWRKYNPSYAKDPHGTSHFSVIDVNGMAVAMTTTVNLGFGNLMCDPITGVVMNSEMDDFSSPRYDNAFKLRPSIYNFVEPGKRPLSSAVPTVVTDLAKGNYPELVIGAAGGSRILTAVFEAMVRIFGYGLPLLEAVAYPRIHHQLLPHQAMVELGTLPQVVAELQRRGHKIEYYIPASALNAILRSEDEVLHAVGDFWRKRGLGAAY